MLSLKSAIKNGALGALRNIDLSKGVMGSLLNDFYKRHPETFPYQRNKTIPYQRSIRALLKALEWPSKIEPVDDYPMDAAPGWGNICQGVANDGKRNWFITNQRELWKIPVEQDLKDPAGEIAFIDKHLSSAGYDHFGDLDYHGGYLYVPLEGADEDNNALLCKIALFSAEAEPTPSYIGSADLFNADKPHDDIRPEDETETQIRAPWCAVNPLNKLLYTSFFNSDHLYVYEQAVANTIDGIVGFELIYKGKFRLFDKDGVSPFSLIGIQGGVFSKNGHLYLVCNADNEDDLSKSGIFGFDMITGRNVCHTRVDYDPTEHHIPMPWPIPDVPYGPMQELEGIDIWDLDAPGAPYAPGIKGQIHVIMVDQEPSNDDIYFKHFRVSTGDEDKI
jgi:hypothetical protein